MMGLLFGKETCFEVGLAGVKRKFLSERKGKVSPYGGVEYRNGTGTNSGKSGKLRRSEAVRRGAYGRCVKLKIFTEIG